MSVWREGGESLKRNSIRRWIVLSFVVILILSVAMSAAANYHEAYAGAMRKAVFALAGDTTQTRGALLACDEALANIVNYSGAVNLAFSCVKKDGELCVAFSDDGTPFDPTAVSPEKKEFDALDSGGMGLSLIAQSVSAMRYERKDGRNVFTLFFTL